VAVLAGAAQEVDGDMNLLPTVPHVDDVRVVAAIAEAEARTSGEIRIVLSRLSVADPVAAAEEQFERLGMMNTADRNGVLIFVAPSSHTFAVIGDQGVHEKCGKGFWQTLTVAMSAHFKRGEFTEGLVLGITRVGALLAEHFPRRPDDPNELPDHIEHT
jgi:uncharacterized membrane protein